MFLLRIIHNGAAILILLIRPHYLHQLIHLYKVRWVEHLLVEKHAALALKNLVRIFNVVNHVLFQF